MQNINWICRSIGGSFPRALALSVLLALAFGTGCQTPPGSAPAAQAADDRAALVLYEGDTIHIAFPGSPNFDTTQQIRLDGKITLIGQTNTEFKASGMTPAELEKALRDMYGPQLLLQKDVNVTVTSSVLWAYVTGSVLRPGKITSDRPLNVLEAIMEAGGFDNAKANLKSVTVQRVENGRFKTYHINMRNVLEGRTEIPFKIQRADVINVPERFTWF